MPWVVHHKKGFHTAFSIHSTEDEAKASFPRQLASGELEICEVVPRAVHEAEAGRPFPFEDGAA